jgi:hypothetical protein
MKHMKNLKKVKIVKSAKKLFHRSVAIGENLWLNKSILTTKGTKNLKKIQWDADQHRFPQIKTAI